MSSDTRRNFIKSVCCFALAGLFGFKVKNAFAAGMGKVLVAYFSASGQTAKLAATIANVAGGELFEIVPAQKYSDADLDWHDKKSRSSVEMNNPASRPAVASRVADISKYDTIFIGFPIWWGIAPRVVQTFLESYDFSGKTVVTFATSGGSPMGDSDRVLKGSCSSMTQWKDGKRMNPNESKNSVKKWIDSLEF